ncbi:hypothetical protein [Terrarubrum flagellatum]|uniref:hypothetical protein n=1 Tax=Terrirubrum flagellatum TaxID=2895980 RepID=UPI0031456ED0
MKPCLHCHLMDEIEKWAREHGERVEDGVRLVSDVKVFSALGEVAADMTADAGGDRVGALLQMLGASMAQKHRMIGAGLTTLPQAAGVDRTKMN